MIERLTRAIQELPLVEPGDVLSLATESGVYFHDDEPGFARLMPHLPESPDAIAALRQDVLSYKLYRGTLVAKDGSAACILIRPRSDRQADEVYRTLGTLLEDFPTRDEQLVVAGEAAVRAHMGRAVSDDALRMNFVCPVIMALLIALAYRTVRGTLLPLAVLGGATVLALGTMALSGVPVYIVTNGIFVIIIAVSVDYAIHIVGQYYEEQLHVGGRTRRELVVDACQTLWYAVLITSATDLIGFLSLYFSGGMPPICYFGLFTSVGIVGALVFSCTVLPAGLVLLPLKSCPAFSQSQPAGTVGSLDLIGRTIGRIGVFAYRRRGFVLLLSSLLTGLAAWGATKLIVNDSRLLSFQDQHPIVRAANALNARFDGTSHLNIVVTAAEQGALLRPEVLRRIGELEAFTETLPRVGGTHSLAGWVQRAHQKMHRDDPAYYAIPDDPEVTKYYLDVIGGRTSPMARLLREVVDPTYTTANLTLRMQSSQYIHQRPVIETLQRYLDEHFGDGPLRAELAGRANLDYHWVQMVASSHINSVWMTALPVFIMTAIMFRSVWGGLLCTFLTGITVLVNYAIMGLGGIPLGWARRCSPASPSAPG